MVRQENSPSPHVPIFVWTMVPVPIKRKGQLSPVLSQMSPVGSQPGCRLRLERLPAQTVGSVGTQSQSGSGGCWPFAHQMSRFLQTGQVEGWKPTLTAGALVLCWAALPPGAVPDTTRLALLPICPGCRPALLREERTRDQQFLGGLGSLFVLVFETGLHVPRLAMKLVWNRG